MNSFLCWLELHRSHKMLKFGRLGFEPWVLQPAMKRDPDGTWWTPIGYWFWLSLGKSTHSAEEWDGIRARRDGLVAPYTNAAKAEEGNDAAAENPKEIAEYREALKDDKKALLQAEVEIQNLAGRGLVLRNVVYATDHIEALLAKYTKENT